MRWQYEFNALHWKMRLQYEFIHTDFVCSFILLFSFISWSISSLVTFGNVHQCIWHHEFHQLQERAEHWLITLCRQFCWGMHYQKFTRLLMPLENEICRLLICNLDEIKMRHHGINNILFFLWRCAHWNLWTCSTCPPLATSRKMKRFIFCRDHQENWPFKHLQFGERIRSYWPVPISTKHQNTL